MRRAIPLLLVAALSGVLALTVTDALAATAVNGIGLIDFSRKPDFKVGQWARYHVTGSGETGTSDDYRVTVAIVGEERFWGEDGFWVETITEPKGGPSNAVATLLSYDIFKDPNALQNLQFYQRKTITDIDENGNPNQQIMKRPPESLRQRGKRDLTGLLHRDTLGVDTVTVPVGHFDVLRLRIRQGSSTSVDGRDSTQYTEMRETRTTSMSAKVPVTGIVREDIDYTLQRKTWLIGRSDTGEFVTLEHTRGSAVLDGMGDGYESSLLPPAMRRSLKQIDAAAAAAKAPVRRAAPGAKAPVKR